MKTTQNKKTNFFSIIKIVLCASIGYIVFPTIIKYDSIQYSTLPKNISVVVWDDSSQKYTVFKLPVKSMLAIDSVAASPAPASGIVQSEILYHENPAFLVWLIAITIMVTIAAGSCPLFLEQRKLLINKFHLTSHQVRLSLFISVGLALVLMLSNIIYFPGYYSPPKVLNDFNILLKHGSLLKVIEVSTIIFMLPSIIVIFLVRIAADNIMIIKMPGTNDGAQADPELIKKSKQSVEKAANNFNFLSQCLRNALQILTIVVVFSVLTSGILGKAVNAVVKIEGIEVYPAEISYVYGMFFSLFLFVVYVPVFLYLKSRYSQLKESITEIEESEIIKDEKWFQSVWTTIKFEGSPLDNFKMAITVLAPLLSSFLPENLHFLK